MEAIAAPGEMVTAVIRELGRETATISALSNSDFYKTGLERVLASSARLLRLPWWAVHLGLYLLVSIAFVCLIDVTRLYPKSGYVSFPAEQAGEFIFTTFMLWHLRESRATAILAAARITGGRNRLIWLRKYLAPESWGWVVRLGNRPWNLRVWVADAALLAAYWGGQLIHYSATVMRFPYSHEYWVAIYPYPQLLCVYPTVAKATMGVAALAHFWWLYGLMAIARGKYPSSLSTKEKHALYLECGRAATQFSLGVSVATVVWVLARALARGFTFWAYLYSLCLFLLFAGQVVIITGARFPWGTKQFLRQLIVPDFAIQAQVVGIRRFAALSAVWTLILGLAPLAMIAGALGKS